MQSFEEIFYLIELMGFGFSMVLTCVFSGQIYLRYKEPDLYRPIKVSWISLDLYNIELYTCISIILHQILEFVLTNKWIQPINTTVTVADQPAALRARAIEHIYQHKNKITIKVKQPHSFLARWLQNYTQPYY